MSTSASTSASSVRRAVHALLAVGVLLGAVAAHPADVARAEEPDAPRAVTLHTAEHRDSTAAVVAAMPDGGAVLAGRLSGTDLRPPLVVERIDADGATVWRQEFSDLPGDRQYPIVLRVDADRIVVAGTVRRRADDGFVRILGHDGGVRSTTHLSSVNHGSEVINAVAALPDGALVVAGRTGGELAVPRISPSGSDGFIALVEPDGSVAWTQQHARRWGETGPVPTAFHHAVVAPDGRILVGTELRCGRVAWCAGMEHELVFLVLDRAGTLADVARVRAADLFPGARMIDLHVTAVHPGPEGIVVVAGEGKSLRTAGLGWDLTVAWKGPRVLDRPRGLFRTGPSTVLADGRIVVAPSTDYDAVFDGTNQGSTDVLVGVLSARGELLDVRQYGGPADDSASGLAVLADGSVLVAGSAGRGLSMFGLEPTARPIGTRLLASIAPAAVAHTHVPGTPVPATTVATDPEWGDPDAIAPTPEPEPSEPVAPVTVDGANGLLSLVSSIRGTERGGGVAALPGSDVTVTSGWTTGTPRILSVTRREADGSVAWTRTFPSIEQNSNLAAPIVATATVAGQPRIVVTTSGRAGATNRAHVVVLDADGTEQWSRTLPDSVGTGVVLAGVHLAADGTVVAVGSSGVAVEGGGSGTRPLAVRYGPDGTLAWAVSSERDGAGMFRGLAVAPDGTLVTSEHEQRNCFVAQPCEPRSVLHAVRIAPEDGTQIERVTHEFADLFAMPIRYRTVGSPYAYVPWFHDGPEGPVIAGLVMRSSKYCLVTAGLGWDLARAWAGPAVHCSDGAGLELWSAMTVLADGRIVTGSSSYYETAVAGPSLGHVDVVLGVHDARGVLLDAVQYGGSFQDVPTGVVATASGDVIVATSAGAGVTSLGAATSVTAVGEHTRLTLVGGVPTWRSSAELRATVAAAPVADEPEVEAESAGESAGEAEAEGESAAVAVGSVADEPVEPVADAPAVAVEPEPEPVIVVEPEPQPEPEPEPLVVAPSAPRDVSIALDGDRIAVRWSAPEVEGSSPVTRYVAEAVDRSTGATIVSRTVRAATRSAILPDVRGRDVEVRVAAVSADGTGVWSDPQRMHLRAPGSPTIVRVEELGPGRLRVHLEHADDGAPRATTVQVRLFDGDRPGARSVIRRTCRGAGMLTCDVRFQPTRTPADGRMSVEARGQSAFGWGAYGDRVPVSVATPRPTVAARVTATALRNGRIDVRWDRAPLAGGVPHVRQVVEVRLGTAPDGRVVRTCTVTGTLSRCAIVRPPQRGEMTVRVRTDNLFGEGEWTEPVRVR